MKENPQKNMAEERQRLTEYYDCQKRLMNLALSLAYARRRLAELEIKIIKREFGGGMDYETTS